jgi:hypothetical protein
VTAKDNRLFLYEKLNRSYLAFLSLVCAFVWLRADVSE